jgi:hypothetical protein
MASSSYWLTDRVVVLLTVTLVLFALAALAWRRARARVLLSRAETVAAEGVERVEPPVSPSSPPVVTL